nr:glycosyltransferase family 2 protein [Bifidobacterium callimiconis]
MPFKRLEIQNHSISKMLEIYCRNLVPSPHIDTPPPRKAISPSSDCDVSIIVPAYNVERYIKDCLTSLATQHSRYSFEIIVVDDGSTDTTPQLIDQCARHYDNIRVITQKNRGFSGARNTGLNHATGKAIMFVDSDDMVQPGHIEAFASALFNNKCDYVTGSYTRIREDGSIRGIGERPRTIGSPWGRIFRNVVWEKVRFPEGYLFEDTVFRYCIQPIYTELIIDDTSYEYRSRRSSISYTFKGSPRSIDTYWIIEELIDECRVLGIPLDQRLYARTIRQFGPIAYLRVSDLENDIQAAFFCCCSQLLNAIPEFQIYKYTIEGALAPIEKALLEGNYQMWRTACYFSQFC